MPWLAIVAWLWFPWTACGLRFAELPRSASPSPYWVRIKAYYTNLDGEHGEERCMHHQLMEMVYEASSLGAHLEFERVPSTTFVSESVGNTSSFVQEHPSCFPTGSVGFIDEPEQPAVLGAWCSRLGVLETMAKQAENADYFLAFQDGLVFKQGFVAQLLSFLSEFPDHWDLVTLDTDGLPEGDLLQQDRFPNNVSLGLDLYSVSGNPHAYAGAHAWLLHSQHLHRFKAFFSAIPVVKLDTVPKAARPLHLGIWAYQTGSIQHRQSLSDVEIASLAKECGGNQESSLAHVDDPDVLMGSSVHSSQDNPSSMWSSPRSSSGYATIVSERAENDAIREADLVKGSTREVLLFGMYESGTDMLHKLLQQNLRMRNGVRLCRGEHAGYCGRVWHHTHPERFNELASLRQCGDRPCPGLTPLKSTVAVVVTRHPFSLLRTLQKEHHDLECNRCQDDPKLLTLLQPCYYREPPMADVPNKTEVAPRIPRAICPSAKWEPGTSCWPSLPDAWNSYAAGYKQIPRDMFHETLFVRYEDLVERPSQVLAEVARAVGVKAPLEVTRTEGNQHALSSLRKFDYDVKFTCQQWAAVCSRLDRGSMYEWGYHGCQKRWRSLSQAIFGGAKLFENAEAQKLLLEDEAMEPEVECLNKTLMQTAL